MIFRIKIPNLKYNEQKKNKNVRNCQDNKIDSEEILKYSYKYSLLDLYYMNVDKNIITATDKYYN